MGRAKAAAKATRSRFRPNTRAWAVAEAATDAVFAVDPMTPSDIIFRVVYDAIAANGGEVPWKPKKGDVEERAKKRRRLLSSEHPDHLCGLMCDGQDGSNSQCARLRRKLGLYGR